LKRKIHPYLTTSVTTTLCAFSGKRHMSPLGCKELFEVRDGCLAGRWPVLYYH